MRWIVVLVLFEAHYVCYGDEIESDWKSRGWYRPRRNYASPSQNPNSFIKNASQRQTENEAASRNDYNQQPQTQNPFFNFGQKAQTQNRQNSELNLFGNRQNAQSASFGASNGQNHRNAFGERGSLVGNGFSAQNQKTFGSSFGQNSRADFAQNAQNQNPLGFAYNQNQFSQSQNSFSNTQKRHNQNNFGTTYNQQYQAQNAFGYSQNSQSQSTFGSTYQNAQNQNTFGAFGQNVYQFQNVSSNNLNFGSKGTFKGPDYLPPYIAPGYLPSKDPTTTRRPYYTTTTTTRRPYFTTTTRLSYTTTTPKPSSPPGRGAPIPSPAMGIPVPPEPEDDDESVIDETPRATTTTTTLSPTTTTTMNGMRTGDVAPAMAIPVPPEPEDDDESIIDETPRATTTTTTTTLSPTTTTTTTTTPPPTTTTTTTTTPPPTTTTTTTTTTTPPPTTTTTTTTTPPPTTTTTTTTTPPPTTTTTTTTTPPPTTTTTTTSTPPPTTTTTTTTTPSPTTTTTPTTTPPPSTTTTTTSTTPSPTTPDFNRMLDTPKTTTTTTTTTITPIDPYKAPEYLPPKKPSIPPSPALAMPVPPEPECDPLDPSTYPYPQGIDQRSFDDPCNFVPVRTTTKKPFVGPAYLPPASNTRVGRSPKTLRLDDVKGARPVWHAGLYTKTTRPYKQICGGSVVRMDVVITAAHCVWYDKVLEPAENYAVAANKVYRPWTEPHDKQAQQSDVREIIVPPRYRGAKTSFQDDIAILKLVTPFTYARGLRPVCISFDDDFDTEQLSEGNSGTVAGWGYTKDIGEPTQYLLWLELPYVDIEKCIAGAEDAFLKYITSDKICAGENHTGKALCKGDSGGGLIFWHGEGELVTPYLRGVASASARADNKECNVNVVGGFTQITAHRRFLQHHLPEVDLNCRYHYTN